MSTPDDDFDVLLFDDEAEHWQPVLSSGTETTPAPASPVTKQEHGPGSEDTKDLVHDAVSNEHAINCIEGWVLRVLEEMASDKPSWSFEIASCRKRGKYRNINRRLVWPGKGFATMRTMARALKIAEVSHRALKENVPITKRDIFYMDVGLFVKQSIVDTLVDDLAATWGLRRGDLNIRASLKGLFCGSSLQLFLNNEDVIRGLDCEETLIPVGESISRIHVDEGMRWVLVVEKEAVFQTLRQLYFTSKYDDIGPGVIITGKGYPDLATRQLVSTLSADPPPDIPILALVDADPHGLEIVTTYKFGSRAMMHENDMLVAPRLQWIGVKQNELVGSDMDSSKRLRLTARDRHKAECMLDNPNLEEDMRIELEAMLDTGYKAEIEIISAPRTCPNHSGGPHALAAYVHDKILASLHALEHAAADWIKDEQIDYTGIRVEEDELAKAEDIDVVKLEPPPSPSWSPGSPCRTSSKWNLAPYNQGFLKSTS